MIVRHALRSMTHEMHSTRSSEADARFPKNAGRKLFLLRIIRVRKEIEQEHENFVRGLNRRVFGPRGSSLSKARCLVARSA